MKKELQSLLEAVEKREEELIEILKHFVQFKTPAPPARNTEEAQAFIADECRLWITVHFYPNETHEEVVQEIENHILAVGQADPWLKENPPTFEWGGSSMIEDRGEVFPSLEVDPNHAAVQTLMNAHETILQESAIVDVSPSVTDGGWFGDAGIPAAIYGPGHMHHAHAVNEQVSIEQLVQYTKVLLTFIYQWCHTKK